MSDQLRERTNVINAILAMRPELEAYGVRRVSLFGSVAKLNQHQSSDIDLLLDIQSEKYKSDIIKFISGKFGRDVEIVEFRYLSPPNKDEILSTKIDIF